LRNEIHFFALEEMLLGTKTGTHKYIVMSKKLLV
jgi:hypothetical protein